MISPAIFVPMGAAVAKVVVTCWSTPFDGPMVVAIFPAFQSGLWVGAVTKCSGAGGRRTGCLPGCIRVLRAADLSSELPGFSAH